MKPNMTKAECGVFSIASGRLKSHRRPPGGVARETPGSETWRDIHKCGSKPKVD